MSYRIFKATQIYFDIITLYNVHEDDVIAVEIQEDKLFLTLLDGKTISKKI